jgi:hypothetical protein
VLRCKGPRFLSLEREENRSRSRRFAGFSVILHARVWIISVLYIRFSRRETLAVYDLRVYIPTARHCIACACIRFAKCTSLSDSLVTLGVQLRCSCYPFGPFQVGRERDSAHTTHASVFSGSHAHIYMRSCDSRAKLLRMQSIHAPNFKME